MIVTINNATTTVTSTTTTTTITTIIIIICLKMFLHAKYTQVFRVTGAQSVSASSYLFLCKDMVLSKYILIPTHPFPNIYRETCI